MLVYNTQLHKKVELEPIEPGKIRMYVCGPTVYDQIHVGNGRTFLAFDVIRRYLQYKGYQVTFAQNLTDVDDKIINRANEQVRTPEEVAAEFSDAFIEQMHRLGVLDPDIRPRATREIPAMIEMIQGLIDQGHAYAPGNGDVYFSVRSDPSYGTVSGRNIDDLKVGARIEANDEKRDPLDFALWKAAKPGEPMWDSPWGKGRPGWHTECSAMVHRYLGTPIDIHGGGQDLQFPHHENEYAQAVCCWREPLANVWMHTGMLLIDGEKMSKSLGNFYTLKEVLDKYPADAVRLLMLQTHYRSPLDFSFERLDGAKGTLERVRGTIANLRWAAESAAATTHELNDEDRAFGAAVDELKEHGFWAGGATEHAHDLVWDAPVSGRLALVMGSEGSGISRLVREHCDFEFKLPQRGMVESLNVAQATTAIAYEWLRRDMAQGSAASAASEADAYESGYDLPDASDFDFPETDLG